MTGTDLVHAGGSMPSRQEIDTIATLANHLAHSQRFRDASDGYQAFAKLMFGRDLGLSATAAMTGVHIVEGKPEIGANIHAQMVKTYLGPEGERYDYKVVDLTEQHCQLEFLRRRDGEWGSLGTYEYAWSDAERAGLASKPNWKKHPRNMLFARAISDGVAFYCPEVTNGVRTYHEGEIDQESAPVVTLPQDVPVEPEDGEPAVLDAEVVEPESEPTVDYVSEEIVRELSALKRDLELGDEWVRTQLVALGARSVPTGRVTLSTIRALTDVQASGLMDLMVLEQERRQEAQGDAVFVAEQVGE